MAGYARIGCCDGWARARLSRRRLLRDATAVMGGIALAPVLPRWAQTATAAELAGPAMQAGGVTVRWLTAGTVELATLDDRQIAFVDAWIWNSAGWDRFGVQKPPEYASAAGLAEYVRGRGAEAVLMLLSHDHGDHMGDFIEALGALVGAGVNVRAVGQSDLMRAGLAQRFRDAGLDPAQVLAPGVNFGGQTSHGAMRVTLVPAVHSTTSGYPAAGFVVDIGGVRLYASGDTDLFGDLRLIGERYSPSVALLTAGGGPFTMGPRDAARACQMLGVSRAVPIHYGHTPAVPLEAGEQFLQAVAELAPGTTADLLAPGQMTTIPG